MVRLIKLKAKDKYKINSTEYKKELKNTARKYWKFSNLVKIKIATVVENITIKIIVKQSRRNSKFID